MEGKKRYIAIVLFLLIGLTLFAFANPVEEEKGLEKTNGNGKETSEVSDKKDKSDDNDGTLETEDEDNTQTQAQVLNQQNAQQVDNTYANALAAVEKAEQALANELENVDSDSVKELLEDARDLIDAVTNDNSKNELTERADIVEEAIDAIALVEALERLVNNAENKDGIQEAIDYRTDNQVNETVENLRNKEVQNVLKEILDELNLILDDNTAPSYDGIKNNETTKEDVTLTVSDDTEVAVKVTLDGEEVTYTEGEAFTKEGVYEVVLVDEAFNETSITFTIDKTAPKFDGLKSGSHYETIEIKVDDATETTITVKNMDTGETTEVANGTKLTADATYYITAEDAAGNQTSIWVAIDTIAPSITGVDETKPTNKNEIVYVSDKFLNKVTIDGVEYTRKDFTVGANNENFKFQKKVTKEGTHTVIATDKYGNTTTKTFVIDKTPNRVMWTSVKTTNSNVYKNIYYVKNGDTITFRMGTSEKLGENPVVTIGGKTIEMKYVKYFEGPKHHEYIGTLEIAEDENEMTEGTLEISISNITDEAGNEVFVYQKGETKERISTKVTTNGKSLIYDRTAAKPHSTTYSPKTLTNTDVTVTIKVNEELKPVEGWTLSEDKKSISKVFTENTKGSVVISDLAGNEVTRYYKVSNIDKVAAVRKSADFYVNGLTQVDKTFYTQYGKTVVVNITTDEELAEVPTFTLHNNGKDFVMEDAIYRGLNDKGYHLYQASYKMTKESGLKDGEITFTVSNIKDKAGNETADVTEATNGRKVALDNKNPVVSGVNNKYHYNTPVTIKAVDYIVHNLAPIVTTTIDGETYELGTEYSTEGTHEFVAYDAAGNRLRVKFTIDYTAPTYVLYRPKVRPVEVVPTKEIDGKLYINEDAEVQFHDNFRLLTIAVNDGKPYTTTEGVTGQIKYITEPGEYKYTVTDKAGNSTTVTVVLDKKAPKFQPEKWSNTLEADKNATFSCPDMSAYVTDDISGVKSVVLDKWYAENWSIPDQTKPGKFTCRYISTDNAGNSVSNDIFYNVVDTTPATIEVPGNEGLNKNEYRVEAGVSVTVEDIMATVTDNVDVTTKIAPASATRYYTKESGKGSHSYDFSNGFTTNELGRYNLLYEYTDNAGNASTAGMMIVIKDTTSPVITITKANNTTYVRGTDVTHIQFNVFKDGNLVHSYNSATSSAEKFFSLDWLGEGNYVIEAIDEAGNKASVSAVVDETLNVPTTEESHIRISEDDERYIDTGSSFANYFFNMISTYTITFDEPVKIGSVEVSDGIYGGTVKGTATDMYGLATNADADGYATEFIISYNNALWFDIETYVKPNWTKITFEDKVGNSILVEDAEALLYRK